MLEGLKACFRPWGELRRFNALPPAEREIVFYSEGGSYWIYLRPVFDSLLSDYQRRLCYVTSDPNDPALSHPDDRVHAFYIGAGNAWVYFFRSLRAGVLVMTMPDLETFQIKRSLNPVHYVYLHHSIVSTHMVYRPGAFDYFDSMFCVGSHHVEEVRQWEQLKGLREKRLFEHGYGPLDTMLANSFERPASLRGGGELLRVLIAPSWGPHGLLETRGADLVEALLVGGHHVTVRPHPRTGKLTPQVLEQLRERFSGRGNFAWDDAAGSKESMLSSDLLISDWSGTAFEFAFGLERPVLFVDVPRKVNNPEYEQIAASPLEVTIRREIGEILAVEDIDRAPEVVSSLCSDPEAFAGQIRASRVKWVFNVGRSGGAGAAVLDALAKEHKPRI